MNRDLLELGTKQFGIRSDLQAQLRHEPNACGGWVLDFTLGCSHACIYCLFSELEQKMFRLMHPGYHGQTMAFKIDEFLAQEKLPPVVYLSYSSDPMQPLAVKAATVAISRLIEKRVKIFLVTKGRIAPAVRTMIAQEPGSFAIQIGVTNWSRERNKAIEPGVPLYEDRLLDLRDLAGQPGLRALEARIDPMFPGIDDTDENLTRVLDDLAGAGVRSAVVSYLIANEALRAELLENDHVRASLEQLSEKVETISKRVLYSVPRERKLARMKQIQEMCAARGIAMRTCGCKDTQLKTTDFAWICHPYRKKGADGSAVPVEF